MKISKVIILPKNVRHRTRRLETRYRFYNPCVYFKISLFVSKHERKFTCNVTLRRVRLTVVTVEKLISTTYFECVFVALGILHADVTFSAHHYTVICGLNGYTTVFHIISYSYMV
jgi:hypothetical protein